MSRLTKDDLNKVCYDPWEICGMDKHCTKGCHEEGGCTGGCHVLKMYRKLADYEDKEENGLLISLPCKVGDIAYYVHREYSDTHKKWVNGIDEVTVDSFALNINLFVNVSLYIGSERFGKTLTPYKTLFFTRSEAEEALAKMGGK